MEVQLHPFFDLGTRLMWVVIFTPRPFYPQWNRPWYSLDRRQDGTQSQSGHGDEEKNSQILPGLEHPIIQPVAYMYVYVWMYVGMQLCKYINYAHIIFIILIFVMLFIDTTSLSELLLQCTEMNFNSKCRSITV